MKKFIFFIISVLVCISNVFFLTACTKTSFLLPYVSELRSDVFEGKTNSYTIRAYYGYKESPYLNDGKVGELSSKLTFILKEVENEEISFSLEIPFASETIRFEKSPNGNLTATLNVDKFSEKEFTVWLSYSSQKIQVTMQSILPSNTLDINKVLLSLEQNQTSLINSYCKDSTFNAEIYARIIVKNEKPYWYLAFANGKSLKAFLADGLSGEVLAIREII